MKFKNIIFTGFFFFIFIFNTISAATIPSTQKIVLIFMDNIAIPILLPKEVPDTVAPLKPIFSIRPPTTTSEDTVLVEVKGEVNADIFLNGRKIGTISSTGKTIITWIHPV